MRNEVQPEKPKTPAFMELRLTRAGVELKLNVPKGSVDIDFYDDESYRGRHSLSTGGWGLYPWRWIQPPAPNTWTEQYDALLEGR